LILLTINVTFIFPYNVLLTHYWGRHVRIMVSIDQRLNQRKSAKGRLQRSGPSLQQHQKLPKIMRDEQLKPLFTLLQGTLFVEQRRCGFWKFFDGSKMTKLYQALQNRLACMKEIIKPWLDQELNDDAIRILMKKSFFNYLKIWSFLTMMIDFSLLYLW